MKDVHKRTLLCIGVIVTIIIVAILCYYVYQWKTQDKEIVDIIKSDRLDMDTISIATTYRNTIEGYSKNVTLHIDVAYQYLQMNLSIAEKQLRKAKENLSNMMISHDVFSAWFYDIIGLTENTTIDSLPLGYSTTMIIQNRHTDTLNIVDDCSHKYYEFEKLYAGMLSAEGK